MREAGRILADCHRALESRILPGITTLEIDAWVEQFLSKRGATPEQRAIKVSLMPPVLRSTRWYVTVFPRSGCFMMGIL